MRIITFEAANLRVNSMRQMIQVLTKTTGQVDENGNVTTRAIEIEYDASNRQISASDFQRKIEFTYNSSSVIESYITTAKVSAVTSGTFTTTYNSDGKFVSSTDPIAPKIDYNSDGYPSTKEISSGYITTCKFDSSGRVPEAVTPTGSNKYEYDENGLLKSDGIITLIEYDSQGRPVTATGGYVFEY